MSMKYAIVLNNELFVCVCVFSLKIGEWANIQNLKKNKRIIYTNKNHIKFNNQLKMKNSRAKIWCTTREHY